LDAPPSHGPALSLGRVRYPYPTLICFAPDERWTQLSRGHQGLVTDPWLRPCRMLVRRGVASCAWHEACPHSTVGPRGILSGGGVARLCEADEGSL
jgi:hypothetical protein